MRKTGILLLFIFFIPTMVSAQLIACRDSIKDGYNFWIYIPEDYDPELCELPVVMFLHGKSLCGNDLEKVLEYGSIDALKMGREIEAIVVAPQTNGAWRPKKVMDLFKWTAEHYAVDTNRFYVLGMSMGGYGTLDFVATYPDKVAAAIALCGGSTAKNLCGLTEVPLWIIHGTADNMVPVRCSQRVVDSMCSCGDTSLLIFNKMDKINHSRLARVFYMDQTYEWLFSHALNDSIRTVNRDYTMTNDILDKAYKGLKPKKLPTKDGKAKKKQ